MTVTGLFNPTHILRDFLAREYAFSIVYPGRSLRVAHAKGTWTCAKIQNGHVVDYIVIQDCCSGIDCKNEMTLSLFKIIQDQVHKDHAKRFPGGFMSREIDAKFIEMAFMIWGGHPRTIISMDVLQPGRNANVDETDGNIGLSPREGEFTD